MTFYTSNTAQGLKWDGMERYCRHAIPPLINSAWNHTATFIPVWRFEWPMWDMPASFSEDKRFFPVRSLKLLC